MDVFEANLVNILKGYNSDEPVIIDYASEEDENFKPIVKYNVCYIVCSVIFNETGDVLMMQEAKPECYGKWYLPAGRLELGETLLQGAKREVTEETGLNAELDALITVEVGSRFWFRFTFIGHAVGGKLKTSENSDTESIQANWFSVPKVKKILTHPDPDFQLRMPDIIPLIDIAARYKHSISTDHRLSPPLPTGKTHDKLLLRLIICQYNNDKIKIIISSRNSQAHLPTGYISMKYKNFNDNTNRLLREIFKTQEQTLNITMTGIVSVEYDGRPELNSNGFCITLLLNLKAGSEQMELTDNYSWIDINISSNSDLYQMMIGKLTPPFMSVAKLLCSFR